MLQTEKMRAPLEGRLALSRLWLEPMCTGAFLNYASTRGGGSGCMMLCEYSLAFAWGAHVPNQTTLIAHSVHVHAS